MQRDQDETTGATYFTLRDGPVARTVTVSDLVMVDMAEDNSILGVEFAVDPSQAAESELASLWDRFPELETQLLSTPNLAVAPGFLVLNVNATGDPYSLVTTWSGLAEAIGPDRAAISINPDRQFIA